MTGQTISHYNILEKLGEGGMGVVYKAEDAKLQRIVALKFLRSDALEGPEQKQRFLREAQAAAALDHPNICTVHEMDEVEGRTFLAMAFVEGRSVKDNIAERPLKLEEALDVAIQTAHGLQAAHEKGIVHRDIKPANLMVNLLGQVKIMDFGLAQLADRTRLTKTSTSLGTPAYMSPEQAQRLPGDRRTDIWSLGVVLYEMVTGRLPFGADREAAVLHAIIHEEHEPVTAVRAGLPLDLDHILRKALSKDPGTRYQHVDEMLVDLKTLKSSRLVDSSGRERPLAARIPAWKTKPAVLALSAVLAMLAGFMLGRGTGRQGATTSQGVPPGTAVAVEITASPVLNVDTPTDYGFDVPLLDVSPDGDRIVFVGRSQQTTHLYMRRLDTFDVQQIPGTEGAISAFFSPDGRSVAFLTHQQLKVVRPEGGAAVVLCDVVWPVRGKWLEDGSIYLVASMGLDFWRASEAGGPCSSVRPGKYRAHLYHEILPGAKFALATARSGGRSFDYAEIQAVSMETGEAKTLVANGYDPRFVSGYLLFGRGGDLFAVRFDADRVETRGPPRRIAAGVRMNSLFPFVNAAASSKSLAYVPGGDAAVGRPAWFDRQGQTEFLPLPEGTYGELDIAADGRIAVHVCGARDYVQIYEPGRGETIRLQGPDNYGNPRWSRRGDRIVVATWGSGDGKWKAVVHGIHTRLNPHTVVEQDIDLFPAGWTTDDSQVAIYNGLEDVLLVPSSGPAGTPAKIGGTWDAALAPGGEWLASSRRGIVVESFDGEHVYQVSSESAFEPRWCLECDELFYRKGNDFFAAKVRFTPEFQWEQPRLAFQAPGFVDSFAVSYAASPDGKRLLAVKRVQEMPRDKIHVIQNWQAAFEAAGASE